VARNEFYVNKLIRVLFLVRRAPKSSLRSILQREREREREREKWEALF
jgi:hypothetical protein